MYGYFSVTVMLGVTHETLNLNIGMLQSSYLTTNSRLNICSQFSCSSWTVISASALASLFTLYTNEVKLTKAWREIQDYTTQKVHLIQPFDSKDFAESKIIIDHRSLG